LIGLLHCRDLWLLWGDVIPGKAPGRAPGAPDGMENAGCILSERIATKKTTPKCLKVDVISASLEY